MKELDELIVLLKNRNSFAFDTETTSLDINSASLVGISFSVKPDQGFYVPIPQEAEKVDKLIDKLKPLLEDKKISKIGQNLKFDIRILKKYDIEVEGELFDTLVAHYLLEPEQRHNLNILSEKYLSYIPIHIEQLIGEKGKNQGSMQDVELEKIKDYASEDADLAFQLSEIFKKELAEAGLSQLASEIEMPLVYVLAEMEHHGINNLIKNT